MTETIEKPDLLAKYRRPGQHPPAAKLVKGKKAYDPYLLSKDTKRHLELRVKFPFPAECPLNSMITNIRGEWRRGFAVTLVYGKNMMVEIKGRNLQELFQSVKEWKVEWIEEFDERFHLGPVDEAAPFIETIEIITPKTEDPPPMGQRH